MMPCEAAFRDPQSFSNTVQGNDNPANEKTMGILEMDPPMHRAYRRTIQPKFLMPEAMGWWRTHTINGIVERLIARMAARDRAELNLDFCARVPVYTITTAIGLDGDEALRFRHAYLNSTSSSRNVTMEDRIRNARIVEDTLLALIDARRAEPLDDLISFLLKMKLMMPGEEPRLLREREIMAHAKLVMVAGRRHVVAADGDHAVRAAHPPRPVRGCEGRPHAHRRCDRGGTSLEPHCAVFLPHGDERRGVLRPPHPRRFGARTRARAGQSRPVGAGTTPMPTISTARS